MIRQFILLSFFILGLSLNAQKNIYESRHFDAYSKDHQILAIIPFVTDLDLKQKLSKKELKKLAEREGVAVQSALETYFSQRKKRKKFNVEFQDVKNTNAILARNNITYQNIDIYTSKQLAKILNVDGIISGSLQLNILLSDGVPTNFSLLDYFTGDSNYGRIGIKVSDGDTGKLLWKYEKLITKKTGKNTIELIDKMMKQASRKFPYDKEKKNKKEDKGKKSKKKKN